MPPDLARSSLVTLRFSKEFIGDLEKYSGGVGEILNGVHSRENETARSRDRVENDFGKFCTKGTPNMGKKLEEIRDQEIIPQ